MLLSRAIYIYIPMAFIMHAKWQQIMLCTLCELHDHMQRICYCGVYIFSKLVSLDSDRIA